MWAERRRWGPEEAGVGWHGREGAASRLCESREERPSGKEEGEVRAARRGALRPGLRRAAQPVAVHLIRHGRAAEREALQLGTQADGLGPRPAC